MFKGDSEGDMCCLNNFKDDDQASIYYDEHWTHFKAESTERTLRLRSGYCYNRCTSLCSILGRGVSEVRGWP